jgi:hypothetical protein
MAFCIHAWRQIMETSRWPQSFPSWAELDGIFWFKVLLFYFLSWPLCRSSCWELRKSYTVWLSFMEKEEVRTDIREMTGGKEREEE